MLVIIMFPRHDQPLLTYYPTKATKAKTMIPTHFQHFAPLTLNCFQFIIILPQNRSVSQEESGKCDQVFLVILVQWKMPTRKLSLDSTYQWGWCKESLVCQMEAGCFCPGPQLEWAESHWEDLPYAGKGSKESRQTLISRRRRRSSRRYTLLFPHCEMRTTLTLL